ncbi:MAG: T9SS type A sorting domain-containing protein, partial [Candidatus Zixiibacteriota bacterium]
GLVALLREKNPNATVNKIKEAILTSTNKLGYNLPDNNLGWGLIDCLAALNALSGTNPDPILRVYAFDHAPINAGDTVVGTVVLKNLGANVSNVLATLANSNNALTIIDGSTSFGNINGGDTVRSTGIIRVTVSDTVSEGTILCLDFNISGSGYSTVEKLYFLVEPKNQRSFVTHNVGNVEFSLTNFGTFGLGNDSFFPLGGSGFKYMNGVNDLYEGGLMIGIGGVSSSKVSDGVRNVAGEPDGDFKVLPGGNIKFVTPAPSITQQSFCRFSDERAENPIGVEIIQNSYAFDYYPYQDFIILQYIVKNINSSNLNNLLIGLYLDWDIPSYYSNAGGYESGDDFAWIAYNNGASLLNYRGVKVLDGNIITAYTEKGSLVYFPNPNTGSGGDGYTELEKMISLADGMGSSDSLKSVSLDLFQVVAVITNLNPGQVDTIAFAILGGDNLASMQNSAMESVNAYLLGFTDTAEDNNEPSLPKEFALHQNYPNPFNSSTAITFNLKKSSEYTLTIYNLAGKKVYEVKGQAKAGEIKIIWDTKDNTYASGVYLYKLTAGTFSDSKKMVLLK